MSTEEKKTNLSVSSLLMKSLWLVEADFFVMVFHELFTEHFKIIFPIFMSSKYSAINTLKFRIIHCGKYLITVDNLKPNLIKFNVFMLLLNERFLLEVKPLISESTWSMIEKTQRILSSFYSVLDE